MNKSDEAAALPGSDPDVEPRHQRGPAKRELVVVLRQEDPRESPTKWEALERASKVFSIAAIPVVLAVMGFLVQARLQKQTVSRDYVQLALSILQEPDAKKVSPKLRAWAVDLLRDNSPTKLSPEVVEELKSGVSILPSLPGSSYRGGVTGTDNAVSVESASDDNIKSLAQAVGRLLMKDGSGNTSTCTAFLVAEDLALTADYCAADDAVSAELLMPGDLNPYKVVPQPVEKSSRPDGVRFALLRVSGNPGKKHGKLPLSSREPQDGDELTMILFRGTSRQLVVPRSPECSVVSVKPELFYHLCDSGGGSSGAPIIDKDGRVIGLHAGVGSPQDPGKLGMRVDVLAREIKTLGGVR